MNVCLRTMATWKEKITTKWTTYKLFLNTVQLYSDTKISPQTPAIYYRFFLNFELEEKGRSLQSTVSTCEWIME